MEIWPRRIVALHRASALALGLALATFIGAVFGPWYAALGIAAGAAYYVVATQRYRRRRALLREPISDAQRAVLARSVSFYRRLDPAGKQRFEDDVRIFVAEQTITGLAGRPVADDTKLLIAASAAMLTAGLPGFEWPRVRDIVVYPRSFDASYDPNGGEIAGMVHLHGPILFSKRDLAMGFSRGSDGHNVGLHEMAHVMDMLDGAADGIPGDLPWVSTAPWVAVVASRLARVRRRGDRHVLRDYAGTNEAELFAVAVEAFFEQPVALNESDPELYEMLAAYFNQDPRRPGA